MTPGLGERAVDAVVDRGVLPDPLLRAAIRRLLRRRLRAITAGSIEQRDARKRALVASLGDSPVALSTDEANTQHYEVPTELFELMLGPRLKYSSALWPSPVGPGDARRATARPHEAAADALAAAEGAMLELTCERALLQDGQDVLELGCGWGSLTLWMAEHYPRSRIVAVSNSATQREHIEKQAALRGLDNLCVLTADVNGLGAGAGPRGGPGEYAEVVAEAAFDRVVSVEMFEHVRNHRALGLRIATWLRPGGQLFVHVFAHATDPYPFDVGGRADWMARHFFTDGLMPSHDLLLLNLTDLRLEDRWAVSGRHYARTLRAWLERLDAERERVLQLFAAAGEPSPRAAYHRWRVFTIACEELFAYGDGNVWHVSHVRFTRRE